jgi:hypothetical protein
MPASPRGNRLQRLRQSYFELLLRAILSMPQSGFDFHACNNNPLYALAWDFSREVSCLPAVCLFPRAGLMRACE